MKEMKTHSSGFKSISLHRQYIPLEASHLHCELCSVPCLLVNILNSIFKGTLHNLLFDPENLHYAINIFSVMLHIQQF